MDELTAFERQMAGGLSHMGGAGRRVDPMAMTRAAATQSPKWRFGSMFSAAKFVVAGAIVALFGGFLLAGVLTQPSGERPPAMGASASAKAESTDRTKRASEPTAGVDAASETARPVLLPGVDLIAEEVRPGVYRVTGDGIRDLGSGSGVRDVVVDASGEVWTLRGGTDNLRVERLGSRSASFDLPDGSPASFSTDPDGTPIIHAGSREFVLGSETWMERMEVASVCPDDGVRMPDGTCWHGMNRLENGEWLPVPREELGLADDEGFDQLTVAPDGTGWASVRASDPDTGPTTFAGLQRFDGQTWSHLPAPTDLPGGASGWTLDVSVGPDGSAWVVEHQPDALWVRRWDGAAWSSFGPVALPDDQTARDEYVHGLYGGRRQGAHVNDDGTAWLLAGKLFFDGAALHRFDLGSTGRRWPSFAPDGTGWVVEGSSAGRRHLVVFTPEAAAATD